MCRNIKILFNFDPPATDEEIHAASVQFVRKLSGFTKPSKLNAKGKLATIVLYANHYFTSQKSSTRSREASEERGISDAF